jgi:betaine-aldehyde dehydrogenase
MEQATITPVHADEVFIGGRWEATAGGRTPIVNAATGATVSTVAEPTRGDADRAVQAARRALDEGSWSGLTMAERLVHVRRMVNEIEARRSQLNEAWTLECGVTVGFRDVMNGFYAEGTWNSFLKIAETFSMSEVRETDGYGPVEIRREPAGVTLTVLTYNAPVAYFGMKVVPALLAGCTVIVKPSPETQLVARLLAEATEAANLPDGVISILAAGTDVSSYLVGHPGVDLVSFTGGTEVGKQIMATCAARMAKCTLELGGKSAGIVAPDMDLESLMPMLIPGMLTFQGQLCTALTRVLVPSERYQETADALVDIFRSQRIGDPSDPETDWGPLAVERARARSERAIAGAVAEGATVATGGKRPSAFPDGWYLEPTLLTNVSNKMSVAQEEIFGPVFTLIPYDGIDNAVELANDSRYGLAGSVFTHDLDLARDVARRVRSGSFTINGAGGCLTQPFGGMKQSGMGRECGPEGLSEYMEIKQILLNNAAS